MLGVIYKRGGAQLGGLSVVCGADHGGKFCF